MIAFHEDSVLDIYDYLFQDLPPVEPIPIAEIPSEMALEEIGAIHSIIKELVIVEAKVSGDYQVLDVDSILSFADRKILGRVGMLEVDNFCFRVDRLTPVSFFFSGL